MYILPVRTLTLVLAVLFAVQGVFVLFSPGSLRFQRPEGGWVPWTYNILNLGGTLGLIPVALVLLLTGTFGPLDATALWPGGSVATDAVGWLGLALYAAGILLSSWSRATLGRSFRLGAVRPDADDRLMVSGPFGVVRHPMYTAVLATFLGLGLVLRSAVFLGLTVAIAATFAALVPTEEAQLRAAYGADYDRYAARTRRLVPFVY